MAVPTARAVESVWSPTSDVGAPTARRGHTAVWTGSRMIVWGGYGGLFQKSGGVYDPAADTWTSTSTIGAPEARFGHTAVWTGSEMIVWGGAASWSPLAPNIAGGIYDPATDSWRAMSGVSGYLDSEAVWTGSEMIVWGGWRSMDGGPACVGNIGRYDPATDVWTTIRWFGAPGGRTGHTAVWTGSEMIVWGGSCDSLSGPKRYENSGGVYDPTTDTWTTTRTIGAPAARDGHTAVWTGSEMIVWGGSYETLAPPTLEELEYENSGGVYDPTTDTWTATRTIGSPAVRAGHTAVWTGSEMIVWGGHDDSGVLDTGGVYDPATDTWTATSLVGAPSARDGHTVVWAGSKMALWAGGDDGGAVSDTGALTEDPRAQAVWADFDADGKPDLLWHHQPSGSLYLWSMDGTTQTAGAYLSPASVPDTQWQIRGMGDLNLDGYTDVLWRHRTSGDLYVWFMNGATMTGGTYLSPAGVADTQWQIRAIVDLNSDKRRDILWRHLPSGSLYAWFMSGVVMTGGSFLTPGAVADPEWQVRGAADFNQDGHPDLLWHHQHSGSLYVWSMDGTTQTDGSYLSPAGVADTQWQVRGVADFDQDGHSDILWRHHGAGALFVWFMNGISQTGGAYLSPAVVPDPDWIVAPP